MKAGVQAIIQKIHEDAKQHGTERYMRIKDEFDLEINSENERYNEEFRKRCEMLRKGNEHELMRRMERLSSRFNREILTYQHNLVNEVFDMAALKLRGASEEEFSEMFKAAVKGLKGKYTAYVGEYSKGKLASGSVEEAMNANSGLEIVLSGNHVPQKSGFVLTDDRVEYNWIFEDLIEDKKGGQAAVVFREVFGE